MQQQRRRGWAEHVVGRVVLVVVVLVFLAGTASALVVEVESTAVRWYGVIVMTAGLVGVLWFAWTTGRSPGPDPSEEGPR